MSDAPRLSPSTEREEVPCNVCGSESKRAYRPSNRLGLVQCTECGLIYVSPRPAAEKLYELYGESYFRNEESGVVGYTDYSKDEPNIRRSSRLRLTHIERFTRGQGRLLDVGCATGFFISEAQRRGWKVEGLDVSAYTIRYAREKLGLDAHLGSLTDVDLPPGAYDAVTMWDVIEHVPDPKEYIRAVSRLLRSGGIYELSTPDIGSLPAKLTGNRWIGYKLSDEHIYYFSVATLSRLLEDVGFDVVHVRHIGKYVTSRLFFDRLGMYAKWLAGPLQRTARVLGLAEKAFYVNPYDIVAITARKR